MLTLLIWLQIHTVLAMSLNLLFGYAGLISISHGALMGVGGYTAALVAIKLGVNMFSAFFIGAAFAAALGLCFGYFAQRLQGENYVLASFAFQMVLFELMVRWKSLTGGHDGLRRIPRPQLFGNVLTDLSTYFVLVTIITMIVACILLYLAHSQFALAVRGLREGERAAQSLGKDTRRLQLTNYLIAGLMAGLAGGLNAGMLRFTHPGDYSILFSITLVVYVVVGGMGNLWGSVVGVALLLGLKQAIGFIPGIPAMLVGPLQQLIYGLVLMLFIWFRPQGVVPERPLITIKRFGKQLSLGLHGTAQKAAQAGGGS